MAMSIGSVGSVPASLASAKTGDAVAVSVLKKTLDIQQQTALQLLKALPAASGSAATQAVGAVGNNVNVFA